MILKSLILLASIVSLSAAETTAPASWTPLLDEKLSQWETYLHIPDPSVVIPGYAHAEDPKKSPPLGVNNDPLKVFTIRIVEGEPILHVTGQIFGVLTTLKSYGDFHLRTQFRWGTIRYAPRTDKPRDTGILYSCFGPHGAGGFWKHSLECQIQEKDIGDFYSLGGTANVSAKESLPTGNARPLWSYVPGNPLRRFQGRCAHGTDYHELPNGEWNTIEIMSVGDRSIHILNGKVVNVLQDARSFKDSKTPLVSGQLQFQSEGAECEYRRIEIRALVRFPEEYATLFTDTEIPIKP